MTISYDDAPALLAARPAYSPAWNGDQDRETLYGRYRRGFRVGPRRGDAGQ